MLNCQIVLCPGLNDGAELTRTLTDLCALMPQVTSVAVVPVGLSKYREGLYPLQGFTAQTAAAAIDCIEQAQAKMLAQYGTRVIFPADELFLLAGREIPEAAYYEDYPQYENGVGMLRSLMDEFADALSDAPAPDALREVSIATGVAAYPIISALVRRAEEKFPNLHCHVYCIRNEFFGTTITVTGLITGQDLCQQLAGKPLGETLLISESMVRRNDPVFLDDITPEAVSQRLQIPLTITKNDGFALLDAILGQNE